MSETKTEVKHEIKPHIDELATKMLKHLTVDKKTGAAVYAEGTYEKLLPEGMSVSEVQKVYDHDANLVSAGALANGRAAIDVMKSNAQVDVVTSKLPHVGRNSFEWTTHRSTTGRNPRTGEETTRVATTTAKFDFHATDSGRGDLKHARAYLTERGIAAKLDKLTK